MKQPIVRIMGYQLATESSYMKFARVACFATAIFVMALSLGKLTRLELTEAELFFGTLLSMIVPLLFIILGFVLPVSTPEKTA